MCQHCHTGRRKHGTVGRMMGWAKHCKSYLQRSAICVTPKTNAETYEILIGWLGARTHKKASFACQIACSSSWGLHVSAPNDIC